MIEFVDTNVLVRFFVGDNPKQLTQVNSWFVEAEKGKRQLMVKSLVIAETCFVLESYYKIPRVEIAEKMKALLMQKWLRVDEMEVWEKVWRNYKQDVHLVDGYLLGLVEMKQGKLLTLDRKLDKKAKLI